jgi:hypothetical protein
MLDVKHDTYMIIIDTLNTWGVSRLHKTCVHGPGAIRTTT